MDHRNLSVETLGGGIVVRGPKLRTAGTEALSFLEAASELSASQPHAVSLYPR